MMQASVLCGFFGAVLCLLVGMPLPSATFVLHHAPYIGLAEASQVMISS